MDQRATERAQRADWPSVVIVGAVRDGARTLRADIARLTAAFRPSRSVSWFFVESDSNDDTVATLESLARETAEFRYVSLGNLRETMPLRAQRMAHCRNRCVEQVRSHPAYGSVEYVAIADLDAVNDQLDMAAIASCWDVPGWDVALANQRGPYYDIWALRHAEWSPNDCWRQYAFLREHDVDHFHAIRTAIHSRMIRIDPTGDWIEVDSAFGGFGLYRRDAFLAGRYAGTDADGREVCEHVAFHADIRRHGGRIFINPALVNAGFTSHARPLMLSSRVKRRIKWLAGRVRP